jgi:hypothetical protein
MECCTNAIIKILYICSDDRSPEVFTRVIESSTQMQAVLTPTTKPNCLIIDEIDGAPTVSIEHIHDQVPMCSINIPVIFLWYL